MAVDEISKHVDVAALADRGDLDPRNEFNAGRGARRRRRVAGRRRVVIGDAENRDARSGRPRDQLGRRAAAVGRGRVCMKIDHRADFTRRRRFGPF